MGHINYPRTILKFTVGLPIVLFYCLFIILILLWLLFLVTALFLTGGKFDIPREFYQGFGMLKDVWQPVYK